MQRPPQPSDEAERQAALDRTGLVRLGEIPDLQDIVELAATICGVPIALVSLVDGDRQFFKARVGLDAVETPRDISFCGHAILGTEPFVIPDATADERFADNPLVTGPPHIRFYAGIPLLVQMVNELLDLARMEAGQGRDFTFEVQALAPIVRETADALLMPGDPRRVGFEPDDGDSHRVDIDAAKLRLAITNVLSNAFKYSRGRGRVLVSLPTRSRHGRAEVGIRVRDEGIGMTPEQLGHVFERFYRADPAGAVSGTGLGMTLVKEIVEAMKGSVQIESVPGSGTTVTLWLPSAGK